MSCASCPRVINEHGADKNTQTLVKLFESNAGVAIAPHG